MRSNNIISFILYFFLFLGFQILIFKNLALFDQALCFIYIGFLLLLPFEISSLLLLLLSFVMGITVDIFYDTLGIHAGASVLIGYMRPYVINILTPKGGYDKGTVVSIPALGFQWMSVYAGIMIFIHHFTLFLLELWEIKLLFHLIWKSLLSSLFTLLVFTLIQYLFLGNRSYK